MGARRYTHSTIPSKFKCRSPPHLKCLMMGSIDFLESRALWASLWPHLLGILLQKQHSKQGRLLGMAGQSLQRRKTSFMLSYWPNISKDEQRGASRSSMASARRPDYKTITCATTDLGKLWVEKKNPRQ